MGQDDFDHEIWELAIHREVEAYYFYTALAERVDSEEMRQVLHDFAAEELEHKAKLELEILKAGRVVPASQELPEASNDDRIITDLKFLSDMNYKEILELAIQKEEAAFRTYIHLVPAVRDRQSREALLAIAEEEVKHKHRFEIEYDLLMKNIQ